jgi:hypothetical protein
VAGTPAASSASTWSFISAMSGDTTTDSPGRTTAGSWKHRLFPPPVGKSAITSRPPSASRMISSWSGRNVEKPK